MPDRVKVIKGLECCSKNHCAGEECPYYGTDCDSIRADALALLKKQPDIVHCKDCKAWKQYDDMNLGECELFPPYDKLGHWFCNFGKRKEVGEAKMKWDQYEKQMSIKSEEWQYKTQINVECPKCGKKIWRRNDIVLTSYPAKYQYECECGWVGYAHI